MYAGKRVVTGHDAEGRSCFILEGGAGAVLEQPGRGLTFHEMWVTDGPLASNIGNEDAADVPVEHHPPRGGTRFRVVEFLPDEKQHPDLASADFDRIGAAGFVVGDPDDPSMHRNDSVDYNIIISGEIYTTTERGEVLLRPGDVLVQRGTKHTWHNRSDQPCVFASVMVSAEPLNSQSIPPT